jgi:adenylate cyclase class 2
MQTEIEVKFLDINQSEMRTKLENIGAVCEKPMRLMRRVVIDNDVMKPKGGFLRVRDENGKVTMTYKQFDRLSVDGAKELEINVSDFDTAVQILEQAGLVYRSFQESRRETWKVGDVEVVLDEWPWLKPYIEIEGKNEPQLHQIASGLGLDWNNAKFGDVMVAYREEYPHLGEQDTVGNIKSVKFGDPLPDLLKN